MENPALGLPRMRFLRPHIGLLGIGYRFTRLFVCVSGVSVAVAKGASGLKVGIVLHSSGASVRLENFDIC